MTACNTETAVYIAPVNGTLALVVFLRLRLGRSSRLRLSCCDFFCFLCLGYGRFEDPLRLAILGSRGGFDEFFDHQPSRRAAFLQRAI